MSKLNGELSRWVIDLDWMSERLSITHHLNEVFGYTSHQ